MYLGVSLTYEDIENPKPKPKPDEEEKKDSDEDDDSDDDGMSKKKKKKKPKKKPAKKSMKKFTYTNEEDVWGRPIGSWWWNWCLTISRRVQVSMASCSLFSGREEQSENHFVHQ